MDADDVMHRDRLAAQAERLEGDPGLAAVGCHVRLFPRSSVTPRLREYEAWLNAVGSDADVARERFIECPVAHPALMMRRDMTGLGYQDRGWPEDYDLILRAIGSGMRIGMVRRRLLGWRNGPSTLSRTDSRYGLDRFTACKAHYLAAGFLSGSTRYILWGYGSTGRLLMKALAAHGKSPTHIVEVKAGRLGQRIHGAHVIPPAALRDHPGLPVVVSVAREGPRTEIRQAMETMFLVEGADYVCTA
jgi:hypothetical protein